MPAHPTNRLKDADLRAAIAFDTIAEEADMKPLGMAFVIFAKARDRQRSREERPQQSCSTSSRFCNERLGSADRTRRADLHETAITWA
jgi:hypothetical protein